MLNKISQHLKQKIQSFSQEDKIIFNNKTIEINKENFQEIVRGSAAKSIVFIDGGQAEIISAGNFCLSFVRVVSLTFTNNKKVSDQKSEFYVLTTAHHTEKGLIYESKVFFLDDLNLVKEDDLIILSDDSSIREGIERAPISKVANIARRLAELGLAAQSYADFVVMDGTLEKTFKNEEKYLDKLGVNVCSIAKSSSLFTTSGNSPVVLLNNIGPKACWSYFIEETDYFVKLHERAKHVFRFSGNKEILSSLAANSRDALFLGYPYGLIAVDRLARISNAEKNSLRMRFLLSGNTEITEYLTTSNAHDILDNLG